MQSGKNTRVWVLTTEYGPYISGGLGTSATNICRSLKKQGLMITVLTGEKNSRFPLIKQSSPQIIRFPVTASYFSKQSYNVIPEAAMRWLKRHSIKLPGIIHIHSLQFTNLALYLQKRYGIPVIYTCHSLVAMDPRKETARHKTMIKIQKRLIQSANSIVVPSRWELKKIKELYPLSANRITVIHHGVKARKVPQSGPSHRLLFVGRLTKMKGLTELIRSINLLKHTNGKVKLDIIGKGSPRYIGSLKAEVRRLGIASRVSWLGYHTPDHVLRMYSRYGALIMPSRQESFGLVAFEAIASGVPLVSTQAGGLTEFVSGQTAQIIPHVKSEAIAGAIRKMWSNRSLTKRRISNGHRLALKYSWSQAGLKYKRLFQRMQTRR